MNRMQAQLEEFHRAVGTTIGGSPAIRDGALRAALIEEEAAETASAIRGGDLVGAIDGLCDLLYVTFGAAVAFGVDLEPFFDEVHRSNLAKRRGPIRGDGKQLKPAGWEAPRIAELLAKQAQEGSR